MRGGDPQQAAIFSYLSPEERLPQDHPLRAIRVLVEAALNELSPQFDRLYSHTGRPSIASEQLLRALLLQVLYTVRSEQLRPLLHDLMVFFSSLLVESSKAGAPIHRTHVIEEFLASGAAQRLDVECQPAFAPEPNPGGGLRGHLKEPQLRHVCHFDLPHLRRELRDAV